MTSGISWCVQHHPSRADLLKRTAFLQPEIVVDPAPDGRPNPWRTYAECLSRTPVCDHRAVLQDDCLPHPELGPLVEQAVQERPDALVVLFVPWSMPKGAPRVRDALARGERWCDLTTGEWVPVVATVWPKALVDRMLDWPWWKKYGARVRADDAVVGHFARHVGCEVWATVPCLVDHLDDVPSLIRRKSLPPNPRRQAVASWSMGLGAWRPSAP